MAMTNADSPHAAGLPEDLSGDLATGLYELKRGLYALWLMVSNYPDYAGDEDRNAFSGASYDLYEMAGKYEDQLSQHREAERQKWLASHPDGRHRSEPVGDVAPIPASDKDLVRATLDDLDRPISEMRSMAYMVDGLLHTLFEAGERDQEDGDLLLLSLPMEDVKALYFAVSHAADMARDLDELRDQLYTDTCRAQSDDERAA